MQVRNEQMNYWPVLKTGVVLGAEQEVMRCVPPTPAPSLSAEVNSRSTCYGVSSGVLQFQLTSLPSAKWNVILCMVDYLLFSLYCSNVCLTVWRLWKFVTCCRYLMDCLVAAYAACSIVHFIMSAHLSHYYDTILSPSPKWFFYSVMVLNATYVFEYDQTSIHFSHCGNIPIHNVQHTLSTRVWLQAFLWMNLQKCLLR